MIEEYIKNQLQEDLSYEQMSIKELVDPFTGESVKKNKKISRFSDYMGKHASGEPFRGLLTQPVICPYRAEQTNGLASSHYCTTVKTK